MSTRQIEVQIMGQSYLLGCPDGGEERLRTAVEKVDATMTRIRDTGKVRARDRIAVLAALNLAFDLVDRPASGALAGAGAAADGNPAPNGEGPRQAMGGHHGQTTSPTVSAAAGDAERWHDLLRRLDTALGDDGRLL